MPAAHVQPAARVPWYGRFGRTTLGAVPALPFSRSPVAASFFSTAANASPSLALRPAVAAILQPDETIILITRPGLWYLILRNLEGLLAVALFWLAIVVVTLTGWLTVDLVKLGLLSLAIILLNIVWLAIDRICKLYILTDRRVIRCTGVFRTLTLEFPFSRIQGVALYKSLRERIFAMGSIVFTTNIESTLGGDVWWLMLDAPDAKLALIQQTMSRYRQP